MSIGINWETLANEEKLANLSDKYNVVTTSNIVKQFENRGFEITQYSEARVRREDRANKQKHFVRMALSDDIEMKERPEVVIFNSYDGSTRLNINIGLFRFVCQNGLILGSHLQEPIKIKHTNNSWEYMVWKMIEGYAGVAAKQQQMIQDMKNIYMSYSDEVRFAEEAIEYRELIDDVLDPRELVLVRRQGDVGKNLFLTFNKVQESLLQGLFTKIFRKEDEVYTAKASVLSDASRIMQINQNLDTLAQQYMYRRAV